MDSRAYIEKWINGTLTEEERVLFEQTGEYRALKRLSDATLSFHAPEFDVPGEYARLQTQLRTKRKATVVTMPWLKPMLRVAALLVVAAGAYFLFLANPSTTIKTLSAQKTTTYLPDSSEVTLNAFSTITFRAKSWSRDRRLQLEGEAFFHVAKGSRFDVETASGVVTVVGTQFNVKMRKDYFEVVCYEGLVEVRSSGNVTQLTPTKVFRIINGVVTEQENTTEAQPGYLRDESSFESVPFAEVLKEFERQYGVTITTRNVDSRKRFTGRFGHSDFLKALQSISIPLNLTVEVSENQKHVVLSSGVN